MGASRTGRESAFSITDSRLAIPKASDGMVTSTTDSAARAGFLHELALRLNRQQQGFLELLDYQAAACLADRDADRIGQHLDHQERGAGSVGHDASDDLLADHPGG